MMADMSTMTDAELDYIVGSEDEVPWDVLAEINRRSKAQTLASP